MTDDGGDAGGAGDGIDSANGGDYGRVVLTVEAEPAESRLDAYLAARLPELSRSRVVQLLEQSRVRVDGRLPRKSDTPEPGSTIEVIVPPTEPSTLDAEDIPLDIRYQDRDLLVVCKPAGLVVHPAPGHPRGTLVNALLYHVDDLSGIGGVSRPGIVHRLDRDTSGLMVVAKHDRSHRALAAALKRRDVRRIYLAAAWGHLAEERLTVDAPIGRSRRHRQSMGVVEQGREARTHFQRLERWIAADLIRAELDTGRTHQIRVHLAHIGHPVVSDATYGEGAERGMSGTVRPWARQFAAKVPRQFLHAAELSFRHPRTDAEMKFEADLPEDIAPAAEWARESSQPG